MPSDSSSSSEEVTVSMIRSHSSRVSIKKISKREGKTYGSIDIHET